MADLSQMSDAELDAAIKSHAPDLSHMSDDELDRAIQAHSQAAAPPPPSALASAGRQALSGFAGNFDDELAGGISAAGRVAGVKNLGTWKPFSDDSHLEYADPTIDPGELVDAYRQNRDIARKEQHSDTSAHRWISAAANTAGMIANPYLRAASPTGMGAVQGLGNSESDITKGDVLGAGKDTAVGAGTGYVAGKVSEKVANYLAPKLAALAEKQAVNATGATGVQAAQFKPGTGRALLDNNIVTFGRSQEGIANAAADALDESGKGISDVIDDLTKQGASGSRDELLAGIDAKIGELGNDPAQVQVVKQLENLKEAVAAGPEVPTLRQMETTKTGFQNLSNYADPDATAAKKAVASVYRKSGEDVVSKYGSDVADKFAADKLLYGQLNPVAETSARRALQVQQSPVGGLLDQASYIAGGAPMVAAKKLIMPRVSSSIASMADGLSKVLTTNPQAFGKWAPALKAAAARGENSLNATDYILQQRDPEYRQKRQEINNIGPTTGND